MALYCTFDYGTVHDYSVEMANIQVSISVSDGLVELAERLAAVETRSRSFVMARWLATGANAELGTERPIGKDGEERLAAHREKYKAQDSKKSRSVSAGGGASNGGPIPVFEAAPVDEPVFADGPNVDVMAAISKVKEEWRKKGIEPTYEITIAGAPELARKGTAAEIMAERETTLADSGKTGRRKKIATVSPPLADSNFSSHDVAACRVYGCLQCKAAKEEF